jgi:hypothetical protein
LQTLLPFGATKPDREFDPNYPKRQDIAEERARLAAQWSLSTLFGGKYKATDKLPQFVVIAVYRHLKKKNKNKKELDTIAALAILLSKYHGIDYPSMLVHVKDKMVIMNKAPKSKIREAFRTCFLTHNEGGAAAWRPIANELSSPKPQIVSNLLKSNLNEEKEIGHVTIDMPFWMRKISPKVGDCKTVDKVIEVMLKSVAEFSTLNGILIVTLCEDVGGCLQKLVTEISRDAGKAVPDLVPLDLRVNQLPPNLEIGWLGKRYGIRKEGGFRDQWKAAVFKYMVNKPDEVANIFKKGRVQFCGYGDNDDTRMKLYEIDCSTAPYRCVELEQMKSNKREDTIL